MINLISKTGKILMKMFRLPVLAASNRDSFFRSGVRRETGDTMTNASDVADDVDIAGKKTL